jgi:ADP-heptose:LPS heptosyltransferase
MLREHLPHVEWSYAVSPGSAEVLEGNPHITEVLPVIRGENSWDLVEGGFAQLKSREFDVVLCTNTLRHHPDLGLATALGIPNRFAFSGKGFSGLINYPVAMGFPDSYSSYFRTMVASAIERPADWPLRPRLHPSAEDEDRAARFFTDLGLSGDRPILACSLGTRQARGNWPDDVLLAILDNARARFDFDIVFTGVESDAARLQVIASDFRHPARVLAGGARLLTFAAFLKRCSAILTLDSGPRHIGNAMGVPVLFTRNLSHSMKEAGAYCETETDLAPPVEYLNDTETDRVAQSQPVGLLADKLLANLTASGSRA